LVATTEQNPGHVLHALCGAGWVVLPGQGEGQELPGLAKGCHVGSRERISERWKLSSESPVCNSVSPPLQGINMKLKVVLLGTVLLAAPLYQAVAETCRANSYGGSDCEYDNGTSSKSRANSYGGQDTQYSDGTSSKSRSNSYGGQDIQYGDGTSAKTRSNSYGGQDTQYSDGTSAKSRSNSYGGQDTQYSNGSSSKSRANSYGGQNTTNN
jgi:hypothetical protein